MKNIPYGHQWINASDIRAVNAVLRSQWLTQGPLIKRFEEALCRQTQAQYAVAVSSGTAGLHLASLAAGVAAGQEVVTSPITFLASANCVLYCGARPVFADVDPVTANITPAAIQSKVNARTKAIIPVHYAGNPCDMQAISRIAKKNKLVVIEDACHALGASSAGVPVGACQYSDMAVFSFHPVKSITTGEGGAILTNSSVLYKKLLCLRNHGIVRDGLKDSPGDWYHEMQILGYNYRITDMQAGLGIAQLKRLAGFISRRREIALIYRSIFKRNDYFDLPVDEDQNGSAQHLFPILLKKQYLSRKKEIFSTLRAQGVGVQVHYIPVYWQPYYQRLGYKKGSCPQAEEYYKREISLPLYPLMNANNIRTVKRVVMKTFKNIKIKKENN